jgi:hypothetical protein
MARRAAAVCLASTTAETFSSELPWAIAMTLIRASARAPKMRAAMPGVPYIPRPTTTTVAAPRRSSTPSISSRAISSWNVSSRAARARSASPSGTLKQIECSDEAWLMSDTEIPARCIAPKVRAAMPGTPSMPLPVTVTSAWPGIADSAFTGYPLKVRRREISVPSRAGSANGRTRTAMARRLTGIRARGCRTFAP